MAKCTTGRPRSTSKPRNELRKHNTNAQPRTFATLQAKHRQQEAPLSIKVREALLRARGSAVPCLVSAGARCHGSPKTSACASTSGILACCCLTGFLQTQGRLPALLSGSHQHSAGRCPILEAACSPEGSASCDCSLRQLRQCAIRPVCICHVPRSGLQLNKDVLGVESLLRVTPIRALSCVVC